MRITTATPDYDPSVPVSSDAEVIERVGKLIGPQTRRDRALCLIFLSDDQVEMPVVVWIDEVPTAPDPEAAQAICDMLAHLWREGDPGGLVVIALVPGAGSVQEYDRQWCGDLRAAAVRASVRLRMVCLVAQDGVRPG